MIIQLVYFALRVIFSLSWHKYLFIPPTYLTNWGIIMTACIIISSNNCCGMKCYELHEWTGSQEWKRRQALSEYRKTGQIFFSQFFYNNNLISLSRLSLVSLARFSNCRIVLVKSTRRSQKRIQHLE